MSAALFPFYLDTSEPREEGEGAVTLGCAHPHQSDKLQAHRPLRQRLCPHPHALSRLHFSEWLTSDFLAFKHIFGISGREMAQLTLMHVNDINDSVV